MKKKNVWGSFKDWMRADIGIDLGTANTLVYVRGKGIVLNEPSTVAVHRDSRRVIAVGTGASEMLGRTPDSIETIRPLKDGVISDFEAGGALIRHVLKKACSMRKALGPPRVLIAVPSGISEVERKAVIEIAGQGGASYATTIPEPMAAAIGVGLPVDAPRGNMIVDIGAGTAEIAIISLGDLVYHQSLRVGGDSMDFAIKDFCRRRHRLLIGDPSAEKIKKKLGAAFKYDNEGEVFGSVRGSSQINGMPSDINLSAADIRTALEPCCNAIVGAVKRALEQCPPELVSDLIDTGIHLAGGGAQLRGLDKCITKATGLPCSLGDSPLDAVAIGTGEALDNMDVYVSVDRESKRYRRRG